MFLCVQMSCVTAGQKDYAERLNLITQSRNDYYAALGIPPGPPTAKGIYGEAEYSGKYGEYVIEPLGDYSVPTGWPMKAIQEALWRHAWHTCDV